MRLISQTSIIIMAGNSSNNPILVSVFRG